MRGVLFASEEGVCAVLPSDVFVCVLVMDIRLFNIFGYPHILIIYLHHTEGFCTFHFFFQKVNDESVIGKRYTSHSLKRKKI